MPIPTMPGESGSVRHFESILVGQHDEIACSLLHVVSVPIQSKRIDLFK